MICTRRFSRKDAVLFLLNRMSGRVELSDAALCWEILLQVMVIADKIQIVQEACF